MNISKETENRIEELICEMTLEEKVGLCHANSKFYSSGVERLGIEELAMMDGPHGVRSEPERDSWDCLNREEDKCTYLPTETALAATWNKKLARVFGETLGSEARHRGKDIILGPGVNIIRTPLCGRNFEYMSEDPCLIEKMAPEVVKGIESTDTAACVKHFALNNQELDRGYVNSEVSDRALYEIYLRGFYSAIIEGGASSVMGAYNRYQGQHCCHNDRLVNKILKGDWGFKGVYLSDWDGVHNTDEAIMNGLDIEMGTNKPYNEYYLADEFLRKAQESEEVREKLDDKVRRILRLMFSVNKFSDTRQKGEFNTKEHQQNTHNIAAEAMVLLKNENNVLPIDKHKLKKLLVVGENAVIRHAEGGSSSGVRALYEVTPLDGIKSRLSDVCEIEYIEGNFGSNFKDIPVQDLNIIELSAGCRSFKIVEYTEKEDGKVEQKISYTETASIVDGEGDYYDVLLSLKIPESGDYSFKFTTNGSANAFLNGKEYANILYSIWHNSLDTVCSFKYEKGTDVDFKIRVKKGEDRKVNFSLKWFTPNSMSSSTEEELFTKAAAADYVIFCAGLGHNYDSEGMDKRSMMLPGTQDALISKLSKLNPNTIVAITAGSPVAMPWIDGVNAVIWNWYGGMEIGHVLCDTLMGDIVPSGKMPFTLPKDYSDTPVARYGEYKPVNCKYNEDILVGYRGFDYDNIEPLFPFGYGLSYSSFEYSDLTVKVDGASALVEFKVTNTGKVKAKEIAQLYIGDPECSVKRPPKELRNFAKIELEPKETKTVSLSVSKLDLSFYDEVSSEWKLEAGEFIVYVGSSSRDIRLQQSFFIKN